ncbi:MerR family transcriptional regulator [Leptothrix discophora]|uniref:MerR family transcriptional regulator n=1 Tax=Leptothrix discophora TaxID=89 RepID=A0ABT9G6Y1_LEPDI|nr:MerR family transcriptional regulator [Leptothrix discophora]MDP4302251.1 MerR family transcriptional regulator [Leptothrix discophora]
MSADPSLNRLSMTIAAVERDTRIGKDTLRVWERRYGFPQPVRDANGERLYPPDQVERLRHIKRLLDAGHRPGRIVSLHLDELLQLGGSNANGQANGGLAGTRAGGGDDRDTADIDRLLELLRRHDIGALRRSLGQALLRLGLERFVLDLVVPLLAEIGHAWSHGTMEIFEEHLASEVLETVLRSAIAAGPESGPSARPRVLLATASFENHGLGLLMAEAVCLVRGCFNMSLGRQTPMRDILLAAQAHQADLVALSFSAASNPNQALDCLTELRQMLPANIEIWAGTPLQAMQRRSPDGIVTMSRLDALPPELERWRAEHL